MQHVPRLPDHRGLGRTRSPHNVAQANESAYAMHGAGNSVRVLD